MDRFDEIISKLKTLSLLPSTTLSRESAIVLPIVEYGHREADRHSVYVFLTVSSLLLTSLLTTRVGRAALRGRADDAPRRQPIRGRNANNNNEGQRNASVVVEEKNDVFEVFVAPPDKFKFNAAHFIAYKGFRERLHGHNYSVSVALLGRHLVGPDGYLVDFGDIKDIVGTLCKELNERFILPVESDALDIALNEETCEITCEDGSRFVMPSADVAALPIVHSSAEEIARYLWQRTVDAFGRDALLARGVVAVQIGVAEMPTQKATFRRSLLQPQRHAGKSDNLEEEDDSFEGEIHVPLGGCCSAMREIE